MRINLVTNKNEKTLDFPMVVENSLSGNYYILGISDDNKDEVIMISIQNGTVYPSQHSIAGVIENIESEVWIAKDCDLVVK